MQVEVWSDVVCPWCYLGKRRLESALADFGHRGDVTLRWRSFELDPDAPSIREGDPVQRLVEKYGMSRADADAAQANLTRLAAAEGLDYHLDSVRSGNTFDAHRLLHLAAEHGVQDAANERFMRGYFTEGLPVGDRHTLLRLATEVGLDGSEASDVLASDRYADDVRADEQQAAAYGISGVPFFVIDQRYGVSGAQPAEVLLDVLNRAWAEANPLVAVSTGTDDAASCEGGSCAV